MMKHPHKIEFHINTPWVDKVDRNRIERAIVTTLQLQSEQIEGLEACSLSFVVVGDEEMTRMHESYRAEAGTTDVLTFPSHEDDLPEEMQGYLGDIIACYPQAARQGHAEGHEPQDELDLLAVHGTLHLLGYDDETAQEKVRMWQEQRAAMEQLELGHVAPR